MKQQSGNKKKRFRLAVVTSHPVQYQAPLLQELARHPRIDLTVVYGHDGSVAGDVDREFGVPVKWDRPLLSGYKSSFINKRSDNQTLFTQRLHETQIVRTLWRDKFDAVLIHSYATFLSVVALVGAKLAGTPTLLRTESHKISVKPAHVEWIKSLVLRTLMKNISVGLAIGRANSEFYRHYGLPSNRIFQTPYCVDNEFLASESAKWRTDRARLKREIGLPEDSVTVAFCGKLIDIKRTADIAHALGILARKGTRGSLLVIGDGARRQELASLCSSLNVAAAFVGFRNQTELPKYYASADVLALPSQSETWGLVINEAMACGIPVVTTDKVGAGRDLIEDGRTGYVYPVGDVAALATALGTLIRDGSTRQRMGDAARRQIEPYSYVKCVEGVVAALDHVYPTEAHSEISLKEFG